MWMQAAPAGRGTMRRGIARTAGGVLAILACAGFTVMRAQSGLKTAAKVVVALNAPGKLELLAVKAEAVTYRGRKAMRVTDAAERDLDEISRVALVNGLQIKDGAVELKLTGDT